MLFALAPIAFAALSVGAAKEDITPDLARHAPVYLAGFGHNRAATAIHDELSARCLAIAAGGRTAVLCGVDSIGLFAADTARIRQSVRQQLGRPVEVIVAALHGHEGPDTMGLWGPQPGVSGINEDYNTLVVERTAAAAVAAVRSARPATLHLARAHHPDLDTFLHDTRPPVVHDSELLLLDARDAAGARIATLINWANHPEALGSANTRITADYVHPLRARYEQLAGGMAIFINGAVGGMQSPLGAAVADPATGQLAPKDSFRFAELIGRRTAEIAHAGLANATPAPVETIQFLEETVLIPLANPNFKLAAQADLYKGRKPMRPDGNIAAPVGVLRFSSASEILLDIALIPGEMYPELSVGGIVKYPGADFPGAPIELPVKALLQGRTRMLFGLANDEIGYIIPKAEWDEKAPWLDNRPQRPYGEVNSVGPEAAPAIANAIHRLVEKLR